MKLNRRNLSLILPALLLAVAAVAGARVFAADSSGMPQAGQKAPSFTLPDQDGKTHSLKSYKGHVVVLAFYPADFTGGCTIEAHTMTAAYKDFQAAGITPVGISVQDVKSHKGFCEKEGIPYTLLADTGRKAATEYGVLMGGPTGVANRVTYIIGKKGHVVYVDPDVNSHLTTCAEDWINWVKAHQSLVDSQ